MVIIFKHIILGAKSLGTLLPRVVCSALGSPYTVDGGIFHDSTWSCRNVIFNSS